MSSGKYSNSKLRKENKRLRERVEASSGSPDPIKDLQRLAHAARCFREAARVAVGVAEQYSSMLERIAIEQQRPSVERDEAMAAIGRILDEVKEERP